MEKKESLTILLDSNSLDRTLPTSSRRSRTLLKYNGVKLLEFLRSPESVNDKELQKIVEFDRKLKGNGSLHSIEITREELTSKYAFFYRRDDVEKIGKLVFKKDELNSEETKATELVFIQATLNQRSGLNIMVTENEMILKNRLWFESHFPGGLLNIMTLEEAVEVVDLLFKHHGEYPISNHLNLNKGYWYWLSFRTKIPFYHVTKSTSTFEKSILSAFAQRFIFLLMSVDEMDSNFIRVSTTIQWTTRFITSTISFRL